MNPPDSARQASQVPPPARTAILDRARQLLRDRLPERVRAEHPAAASVLHLHGDAGDLVAALNAAAASQASHLSPVRGEVQVEVHDLHLSVAGVVSLLEAGAVSATNRPLATGRYCRVTLTLDLAPLATFWFPYQ